MVEVGLRVYLIISFSFMVNGSPSLLFKASSRFLRPRDPLILVHVVVKALGALLVKAKEISMTGAFEVRRNRVGSYPSSVCR